MEQNKLIELLTERIYTFISDPGHGWLKVPLIHLKHLNLLDKITPYSYYWQGNVYLEEDCDATTFLKAWEAVTGKKLREYIHEENQGNTPIRSYPHYKIKKTPNPPRPRAEEREDSEGEAMIQRQLDSY
jgi:hypothetical protein